MDCVIKGADVKGLKFRAVAPCVSRGGVGGELFSLR